MLDYVLEMVLNSLLGPASVSGPYGFHIEGSFLFVASTLLSCIVIFLATLVWAWQDAQRRGKNGFVVVLFLLLTGWPLSFIWWFFLRPPFRAPLYQPGTA